MPSQFDELSPVRSNWRTQDAANNAPDTLDKGAGRGGQDLLSGPEDDGPNMTGVYSSNEQMLIGWGTTQRKVMKRVFYYVEQDEYGRIYRQVLNSDWLPNGDRQQISREEALNSMLPEPDAYFSKVLNRLSEFQETLNRGDMRRTNGELYSAEFEYQQALKMQDGHVRAMFGLGLVYLDREDTQNANEVFERLISAGGTYNPEHKHLFNEFGIKLRKAGMLNEALKYYLRAFRLDKEDEHLQVNIARVLYEKGKARPAVNFLHRSLKRNPNLLESQQFIQFIKKKAPEALMKGKQMSKFSTDYDTKEVLKTTGLNF